MPDSLVTGFVIGSAAGAGCLSEALSDDIDVASGDGCPGVAVCDEIARSLLVSIPVTRWSCCELRSLCASPNRVADRCRLSRCNVEKLPPIPSIQAVQVYPSVLYRTYGKFR